MGTTITDSNPDRLARICTGLGIALCVLAVTACGGGGSGDDDDDEAGGGTGNNPPVCAIDSPAGTVNLGVGDSVSYAATVTDPDAGDVLTISWTFPGGSPAASDVEDPGAVVYPAAGTFVTTLEATDSLGAACAVQSRTVIVSDGGSNPVPDISINSRPCTLFRTSLG